MQLRQNIARHKPRLDEANKQHADQLAAIANGFVLNVQFRTESAELAPHFKQQLTHVMNLLDAFPELIINVNGYADQRGTDQFNHALSQQRVNAVDRYLQAAGVAANRIRKVSHGERQAQYSTDDMEGMSFDRRVVLYFCRRSS
jgi:outer membrane protein OmpA-like peptidoglycan-associated protein